MIKFLYFTFSFKVKDGVGFHNIFHPPELVCLRILYFLLNFFILLLYSVVNCNSVCSSNSLSAGEPLRKNQCFFLCCWVSGQVKNIVSPPSFLSFFLIKKNLFYFKLNLWNWWQFKVICWWSGRCGNTSPEINLFCTWWIACNCEHCFALLECIFLYHLTLMI